MIKNFIPRLAERGRIKIGEKGEMKTSSQGKQFAQPKKLDHMVITTMQRDAAGRLIPDTPLMARLNPGGGKITEIPIHLLYDDIDLNFLTRYACYRGTRCWCSGDGEAAQRLTGENGKYQEVPCPCERQDPLYQAQDKCKTLGTLKVLIEGVDRVGGVWSFRTTSWNSVNAILSSLALIKTITGGPLAGIPLWMVLSPKTFTLPPAMDSPGVENKLAFDADWQPCEFFSEAAYFRMVIDFHFRQEGLGVIIDWKTNRAVPQTVEKDLQLRTYGWGLKQSLYPEIEEVLLRLHFLRYGKEREVLLSFQDLAGVPDELQARIEVIEADHTFAPTPGSFCGWCGVTAHCPVMAKALVPLEVMAPATLVQAEKAASLLLTLQNLERELASRLKDWVREHGPVQVGDLVYGPTEVVSFDLDAQAVVQFLLEAGLEREAVWPLLNLTKTSLDRGLKKLKRKDLLGQILDQASRKITERIDFRKAKEGL